MHFTHMNIGIGLVILALFSACSPPRPENSNSEMSRYTNGDSYSTDTTYYDPSARVNSNSQNGVFAPYKMGGLDSAVLYCWCFKDGRTNCTTWARVSPSDICKPDHRYLAITDKTHLANFRALINRSKSQSNHWGYLPDSRFVIWCFEKDSSYMLTYNGDSLLIADESRELVTAKPILAWIMSEMGLSEINCQEGGITAE